MSDAKESVRLDPAHFGPYKKRGDAWFTQNDYALAHADYDVAIQVGNSVASSYLGRSWHPATCPDACFRDGKRADADAVQAYQLSPIIIQGLADGNGPYGPDSMRTQAAAYAECGDFKAATE